MQFKFFKWKKNVLQKNNQTRHAKKEKLHLIHGKTTILQADSLMCVLLSLKPGHAEQYVKSSLPWHQ